MPRRCPVAVKGVSLLLLCLYLCVLGNAVIDDEKEKRLYQGAKKAQ